VNYRVDFTGRARDDLERLANFTLERELARDNGDLELHGRVIDAITRAIGLLEWAPFTCRPANEDIFMRELVIPFGSSGYVVLFEIAEGGRVAIAAIRHQREDHYCGS
jgi:plasmid stabilization system protein ParE